MILKGDVFASPFLANLKPIGISFYQTLIEEILRLQFLKIIFNIDTNHVNDSVVRCLKPVSFLKRLDQHKNN